MRWQDMIPGEAYVLAGDPSIKVTLLDTSDELRAQARVLVRFETGVSKGRETDIPSRRVGAPWHRSLAPKRTVSRPRHSDVVVALSRPARVRDSVTLPNTGELIWTVDAIDETSSTATVSTVIFERPERQTVALDALQVRPGSRASTPAARTHGERPAAAGVGRSRGRGRRAVAADRSAPRAR